MKRKVHLSTGEQKSFYPEYHQLPHVRSELLRLNIEKEDRDRRKAIKEFGSIEIYKKWKEDELRVDRKHKEKLAKIREEAGDAAYNIPFYSTPSNSSPRIPIKKEG